MRLARARSTTVRKAENQVLTVGFWYVSAGGVCVMMLSGLFRMALITGCKALVICWATHWAAFCSQQVTSSGLRQTAAWAVAPILCLEEAPAPRPTSGVIPGLPATLILLAACPLN